MNDVVKTAVAELKQSLPYRWGWGRVKRPTDALAKLLEPAPQPVAQKPLIGALVVNAGNCDVELLRQAGVTHVCVELNEANAYDLASGRWAGLTRGWLVISRGDDGAGIANGFANGVGSDIRFVVVDTESHKVDMGGQLVWTERLYAAMRATVGPSLPLYNVTFGIHSSPAVVNHLAFRRHNVTPIWEAYRGPDESQNIPDGATTGVAQTVFKAVAEEWKPVQIALGGIHFAEDIADLRKPAVRSLVSGVWLWSPDNGPAQDGLRAGAAVALREALA